MFLPVEVWVYIDEDEEDVELAEADINPMHIESIEPEYSYGDCTLVNMVSGNQYTVNMCIEDFRKALQQATIRTFLS
jgi:uncharacterized protein YlzI (FlbEa/FlbD family)